jgi:hypothetical protein
MFLENNYIVFSPKLNINSISNYRNIMMKFINKYIELNTNKEKIIASIIISDAIIYSKYYLYHKTKNCVYNDDIMSILYDVNYQSNNVIR